MSVSYQHKKYAVATKESNFLTRLHVEQENPVEAVQEAPVRKQSMTDFALFAVLPASLLGMGVGDFLHRVFG
jgi:hypothetical protein